MVAGPQESRLRRTGGDVLPTFRRWLLLSGFFCWFWGRGDLLVVF